MTRVLLLSLLILPLASLQAEDDEARVTVLNSSNALIMVSAPGGGAPDAATRNKLQQRITCDFDELSLDEVVSWFQRTTNLNIVLDSKVVDAPPVTLRAKDMRAGTALEWVAKQAGVKVSYLFGAVYISDSVARGPRKTKIYDVTDLAKPIPHLPGPQLAMNAQAETGFGGLFDPQGGGEGEQLERPTVEDLAEIIEKHINGNR